MSVTCAFVLCLFCIGFGVIGNVIAFRYYKTWLMLLSTIVGVGFGLGFLSEIIRVLTIGR